MSKEWEEATEWERLWWGSCRNTFEEERKQLEYARRMGITPYLCFDPLPPPKGDLTVLDIGGGPVSLLLKTPAVNGVVVDPCDYPEWVIQRYSAAGIGFVQMKGEDYRVGYNFDEVWIYNCLQHTEDPQAVIRTARGVGSIIRIFEWIHTRISNGHLHNLNDTKLDAWLGGQGKVELFSGDQGLFGYGYYGIFKGDHY